MSDCAPNGAKSITPNDMTMSRNIKATSKQWKVAEVLASIQNDGLSMLYGLIALIIAWMAYESVYYPWHVDYTVYNTSKQCMGIMIVYGYYMIIKHMVIL